MTREWAEVNYLPSALVCDYEIGGAFPGGGTDGLHDSPWREVERTEAEKSNSTHAQMSVAMSAT
jgi:hypothetical protein